MINRINRKYLLAALDQSTTSTKFIIFDDKGLEVENLQPGYLEHNIPEIIQNVNTVIDQALNNLELKGYDARDIRGLGITNQRETVVAFNNKGAKIQYNGNAIVWCDGRTNKICQQMIEKHGKNNFKHKTGLPISPYFSGFKIKWMIENNQEIRNSLKTVKFGTIDSILCQYLTGNFYTDMSNASRTFLMDLNSLNYDKDLLELFGIDENNLPQIKPSCNYEFGQIINTSLSKLKDLKVKSIMGDQHSASLGHGNIGVGDIKHTYGTGCFMMMNAGKALNITQQGLLNTVLFSVNNNGSNNVYYGVEGAIETGAQSINWIKQNMGLFDDFEEMNQHVLQTSDNGGVYFIPAFSGLYSPFWTNSTGMIVGLSHNSSKSQIIRATLESICYRTKDVFTALQQSLPDFDQQSSLKVDGGITINPVIMQMQSDILSKPIHKTKITDSTAWGTAFAAGLGTIYSDISEIQNIVQLDNIYHPNESLIQQYSSNYQQWNKAIQLSTRWDQC